MTIPKTMKAAILVNQKQPLKIDYVQLPDNLDYGQVLVKVMYSGICGSQLGEINGVKGEDHYIRFHFIFKKASQSPMKENQILRWISQDISVCIKLKN